MNEGTTIIIDDGDTFIGTVEQFRDCFFSNADEGSIQDWADSNGYSVRFEEN